MLYLTGIRMLCCAWCHTCYLVSLFTVLMTCIRCGHQPAKVCVSLDFILYFIHHGIPVILPCQSHLEVSFKLLTGFTCF